MHDEVEEPSISLRAIGRKEENEIGIPSCEAC